MVKDGGVQHQGCLDFVEAGRVGSAALPTRSQPAFARPPKLYDAHLQQLIQLLPLLPLPPQPAEPLTCITMMTVPMKVLQSYILDCVKLGGCCHDWTMCGLFLSYCSLALPFADCPSPRRTGFNGGFSTSRQVQLTW